MIETDPRDAIAYYNRGIAYCGKRNYDQAIGDYTKAIEINPRFALAYLNRALALAQKGKNGQAIDDFKMAAKLGDNDAQDRLKRTGITW
ncbi:hypothetical protein MBAV_001271 [Candidatus Magnetobacterium bavaricum]|uniref:Uncharacterized protein n=1 Tax=Candidatus Magnetobacterium bavaricum TaxID=29290 RepID=A0A0F3GXE6_9BACT|nr:hypothetical protein MBAV_001271 [Candidatus Magnetobacterium bavaricum]